MSSLRLVVLLLILSLIQLQVSAFHLPKPFNEHVNFRSQPSPFAVAGVYAIFPTIPAVALPMLVENFRASQDPTALLLVLIAKRSFIYILATLATFYSGWRASTSTTLPAGESLDALNREILKGEVSSSIRNNEENEHEHKDDAIFAALDEQGDIGKSLALALPFFLATALTLSYVLVTGDQTGAYMNNNINTAVDAKEIFKTLSTLSNFSICLLFAAAEYRSFYMPTINTDDDQSQAAGNIFNAPNLIAFGAAMGAFLLPLSLAWPLHNSINIAIAVTVTRALAPFINGDGKSIQNISLALVGLSVYDVCSVFGTNFLSVQSAAAAVDVSSLVSNNFVDATSFSLNSFGGSTSFFTVADSSVMETVARAKLQGPWRPGLLEMVLVGRVSDAIGLGDIVFPACLVSWGFTSNFSYGIVAIIGYVLGSFLTEVASIMGPEDIVAQGLPALLFITPAMLMCVSLLGLQRGEIDLIWGKDKKTN